MMPLLAEAPTVEAVATPSSRLRRPPRSRSTKAVKKLASGIREGRLKRDDLRQMAGIKTGRGQHLLILLHASAKLARLGRRSVLAGSRFWAVGRSVARSDCVCACGSRRCNI